jgi:hypothetical protein
VEKGAEMKSTLLTDVFTMEDFKTAHGDKAIILFIETEDGKLSPVLSEDEEIDGSITIHSLVLEQDNPEAKALKKKEVSEEKS